MNPPTPIGNTGLVLHVTVRVASAHADLFRQFVRRHIARTQAKPGCNGYTFAQDVDADDTFHIVEGWTDRAALDAHNADPAFRQWLGQLVSQVRILSRTTEMYVVGRHERASPLDAA